MDATVEYKALACPPSKRWAPAWFGCYRLPSEAKWWYAAAQYGRIRYQTPEAAIAGAKVCAGREGLTYFGEHTD